MKTANFVDRFAKPCLVGILLLGVSGAAIAQLTASVPPVKDFFANPAFGGAVLSPGGDFLAASPIHQAARIRRPLLLAYGSQDERVPSHQGKKFRDAVKRTNRQVEWVEYDGEGHGWSLPKNRIDFWERVERFLHKHIGQPGASGRAQAPQ